MSEQSFDLVVLGGGPAGTSGAFAAGLFGRSVALVEREEGLGGAGANTGTVPSKTLRESALLMSGWRNRKLLGVDVRLREEARLSEFTRHAASVSAAERRRLEERAAQTGVRRFTGTARFLDGHTIAVDSGSGQTTLRGDFVLIATGSSPARPPEYPFGHPRVHDSDGILRIEALPRSLAVVGAGVIGAEYACTFAALGVEVHVIDGRDSLLPFLDADVSAAILNAMTGAGVRFHWKERVVQCVPGPSTISVTLSSGAALAVTDVLVAAGRTSNTAALNLQAAGLTPAERGVLKVGDYYRTEVPHIYAAGDVVGGPALAATAVEQARVAVFHAFDLLDKEFSTILPTGIYTIPEAAMAGESEATLKEKGINYIVGRANYAQNPRGRIIGDESGFLKLLFRADDLRLLGVHAVGEQATELVHIGLLALHCGGNADLFSRVCFNYPTLGDLYKYAAYAATVRKVLPDAPLP